MSEVAGRMSIQEGAKFLERPFEGRGILLGGVPGVLPANVVVLGGGIVGANAAKMAAGLGANVILLDINLDRLRYIDDVMPTNVTTLYSDRHNILDSLARADLLIGAVLIPGAKAPRLVRRDDLKRMPKRAVIIDVAIDQGGCIETSRPTTHSQPTYIEEDVVHYCVTNMPGAVGRTSTYALTNVTLPYVLQLAKKGFEQAIAAERGAGAGRQHSSGEGDESGGRGDVRAAVRIDWVMSPSPRIAQRSWGSEPRRNAALSWGLVQMMPQLPAKVKPLNDRAVTVQIKSVLEEQLRLGSGSSAKSARSPSPAPGTSISPQGQERASCRR